MILYKYMTAEVLFPLTIHKVETIGEKIRRLRLERGMSQSEVADGFVTVSMISQIENGRNTASVELLNHIARKLQIPLHELVKNEIDQMEGIVKHKLVKVYLETGHPSQAEPLLKELRSQADLSQSDSIELAIDHAECLNQLGKYNEALDILLPLVTQLENNNYDDAHTLAQIRNKLGNSYFQKSDLTTAYYNYRKAYDLIGRFETFDQLAAFISYNLGNTLNLMGHGQQALLYLDRAYSYFRNVMDIKRQADTLFAHGRAYYQTFEVKKAAQMFEDASVLYKGLNLISWAVKVQHNVALLLTAREDKKGAVKALKECAEYYLDEKDYKKYILVLARIAEMQLADYPHEAERMIESIEAIIEEQTLQDTIECAVFLQAKSKYYLSIENYSNCIEEALKSASLFDKMGIVTGKVDSLEVAVDAYQKMGNLEQALKLERERSLLLKNMYPKGEFLS
jgi:tetratricopeptide (TPR) repeat protein